MDNVSVKIRCIHGTRRVPYSENDFSTHHQTFLSPIKATHTTLPKALAPPVQLGEYALSLPVAASTALSQSDLLQRYDSETRQ